MRHLQGNTGGSSAGKQACADRQVYRSFHHRVATGAAINHPEAAVRLQSQLHAERQRILSPNDPVQGSARVSRAVFGVAPNTV